MKHVKKVSQDAALEQSMFARGQNVDDNAYLDRSSRSWSLRADGFWQAAELLADDWGNWTFLQKNTLTYPLIVLYRHYVELRLKEIIVEAKKCFQDLEEFPKHHDLNNLWAVCKQIVRTRELPMEQAELQRTGRYLQDFNVVDSASDVFRYPAKRDGKPSLPNSIGQIDIPAFRKRMDGIRAVLEKLSGLLDADIDLEREYSIENIL